MTSALCLVVWFFAATGKRVTWLQFFWRSFLIGSVAGIAWTAAENAGRKIEKELERVRMKMHAQRAETYSPPTPESVEWVNAILKVVWGLLNPDMFVPIVDVSHSTDLYTSVHGSSCADGRRRPSSVASLFR